MEYHVESREIDCPLKIIRLHSIKIPQRMNLGESIQIQLRTTLEKSLGYRITIIFDILKCLYMF